MESAQSARSLLTPNRTNISSKRKKGISVFSEHPLSGHRRSQPNLKYISLTSRNKQEESCKREIRLIVRGREDGIDQPTHKKENSIVDRVIAQKLRFDNSASRKIGVTVNSSHHIKQL
jgi:hypothetical protein